MAEKFGEGVDSHWVEIQKKTFTRWMNTFLLQRGLRIDDVTKDLNDGIMLINLMELISDKKIARYNKKPKIRAQKLENTEICLKFITEQKLKLVGIGAADLIGGNLKLILGLLWTLILRYQIQKGREEASKNALLEWVRSKIPEYNVQNFTSSWADGMALCALTEVLNPGHINMDERSSGRALENATIAEDVAEEHMNIPKVLMPEEFISPDVDALSVMTYISYFRDYDENMNKLRDSQRKREEQERLERTADPGKCTASGPGLQGGEVDIPADFAIQAKNYRSNPLSAGGDVFVVTIKCSPGPSGASLGSEIVDNNDGTYGVTYVPAEAGKHSIGITLRDTPIAKSPFTVPIDPPTPYPPYCTATGVGVEGGECGDAPAEFTIQARNRIDRPLKVGGHTFRAQIQDSFRGDCTCSITDNGDGTYLGSYVPCPGEHIVEINIFKKPIKDSPFRALFTQDPRKAFAGQSYAFGPGVEGGCDTASPCCFTIQAVSPSGEKLTVGGDRFGVDVVDPNDEEVQGVDLRDNGDGTYSASYNAQIPGVHRVDVFLRHPKFPLYYMHIKDSPFTPAVGAGIDAGQCTAYGPGLGNDVYDTKPTDFTIQARDILGDDIKKGGSPFVVEITDPDGSPVDNRIDDHGDGTYGVDYQANTDGPHMVNITLDGKPIAQSPYKVSVKQGADFQHTAVDTYSYVICARTKKGNQQSHGGEAFETLVEGPKGLIQPPPSVKDLGDGFYGVSYKLPPEAGKYVVSTTFGGQHIKNSPCTQLL